ncbi:S-layer homology domain-containing protein [Dysosmobacter sp.]|uniref:S-layer homology domain-containing protein n=1 Tax=Dysosmobacter sp. TaxID=2591382 RepID=UPI002A95BE8A|nr:S-layer homology domain-containing protein [Dysosmobacter sp.]MDY5611924.1 S-layer homology domain-containing protein [Dysosmobacter sp.]
MKKRFLALLLALCLLSMPALASQDSTDNFVRLKTYTNQFSDLAAGSTFYANVSALYEYGLSVGNADGTYGLTAPLSVGQAIIFAARIRSLYRTGDPEEGPAFHRTEGQPAAIPYLLYLRAEGISLDAALDGQLTAPATRAQMAHILANILPEEALPSVYDELVTEGYATRRAITDVSEYTPYYQDILALYRKGVCMGSDRQGSFRPDDQITRGAAAAMLTRMVDPSLRVAPQWSLSDPPAPAGSTLAQLVEPGEQIASPATSEEMDSAVRYMLSSGSNQLTLTYPELTVVMARKILNAALTVVKQYSEQSYNSASCTYNTLGAMTITFSATAVQEELPACREATMDAALAIRQQLWEEGQLTDSMSQWEMARVYYDWVCENCVYDNTAGEDSLSHLPYSLFQRGTAVCDGYTGAYNLLLKLEGIQCTSVFNDTHIWTSAVLDGTEYHIDTTWGDGEQGINYTYFAMTPAQSRLYHAW